MFKKFEEIIEDHKKRNDKSVRVVLIFFIALFLIGQVGVALLIHMTSSAEKLNAIKSYEFTTRHYVIAALQILFVGWWTLSYLKFKQLRSRVSLMDELIVADYKETGMNVPESYITWDETERTSILSKKSGIKIILMVILLIFVRDIFSLPYKSMYIIFIAALMSYEFVALRSSEVIKNFLVSLESHFIRESNLDTPIEQSKTSNTTVIEGIIAAGVFAIISHSLLGGSLFGNILYFFIFLGLYSASNIIKYIENYLMSVVKFADSVRWNRQRTAEMKT